MTQKTDKPANEDEQAPSGVSGEDVAAYLDGHQCGVMLPLPVGGTGGTYDYRVPPDVAGGLVLSPGDFIKVPLGHRQATGVVWGDADGGVAEAKIKNIIGRLDCPPLPDVNVREGSNATITTSTSSSSGKSPSITWSR